VRPTFDCEQTKEKIITDLKGGRGESDSEVMVAEVMQLRRERDSALTELEERQSMIEQMRKQSQLIESHNLVEVEELRVRLEELQLTLQRERRSNSELRDELAQLSQVPLRLPPQKIKQTVITHPLFVQFRLSLSAHAMLSRKQRTSKRCCKRRRAKFSSWSALCVFSHHLFLSGLTWWGFFLHCLQNQRLSDEIRRKGSVGEDKELERKMSQLRDSLVEKQMQIEKLNMDKNSLLLRLETEAGRV